MQLTGSSYPNVLNTDNESSDDQVLRIFTASTPIITQTVVTILKVMVKYKAGMQIHQI